MKRAMLYSAVIAMALTMAGVALAQPSRDNSLEKILQQQNVLKADLADNGIEGLTPRQSNIVRRAQDEVFLVTAGKTLIDELSMEEKIRLENALERINAQVRNTRAGGDEQNVCWREAKTGTTIKETRCGTVAEMREAREGARDYLERPKTCAKDCRP